MELETITNYLDQLSEVAENEEEKQILETITEKMNETIKLAAISSHKTGTSTGTWDGPTNKTRAKTDQEQSYFAKIYAWRDPDKDPKQKTSYKFIHHEVGVDGTPGAANVRGCQTGIAVLNGARGGTVIPGADKSGVWTHLASHIRDADKTPAKLLEDMTDEEKSVYLENLDIETWEEVTEKMAEKDKQDKVDTKEFEEKIKALEAEKVELAKQLEEKSDPKDIDAKLKALDEKYSGRIEKLEEERKTLVDDNVKLNKQLHDARIDGIVRDGIAKGWYPAQAEIARTILKADGDTIQFFEEDKEGEQKAVTKSLEDAVVFMLNQGPKVDLEEKAVSTEEDKKEEGDKVTAEDMEKDAKKYAEEHGCNLDDARTIIGDKLLAEGKYPLE